MNFNLFGIADWITTSFPIIRIIMIILLVLLSIGLTICVFMQSSGNENVGAITGQSGDTFYSKNKGRSIEGFFKKLTIIMGISIAVISILFFITLVIYPAF